jgi:hypothetical protein
MRAVLIDINKLIEITSTRDRGPIATPDPLRTNILHYIDTGLKRGGVDWINFHARADRALAITATTNETYKITIGHDD